MKLSSRQLPTEAERRQLRKYERRYAQLRRQLTRIGYVMMGTITVSHLSCGQPTCRCQRGGRYRHGPYYYWTTKVKGKTVSRLLSDDEAKLYLQWVANRRQFDQIQREMFAVSRNVAVLFFRKKGGFLPIAT